MLYVEIAKFFNKPEKVNQNGILDGNGTGSRFNSDICYLLPMYVILDILLKIHDASEIKQLLSHFNIADIAQINVNKN